MLSAVNKLYIKSKSLMTNIQVTDGCLCITWITRESAIPSLVALAKEKVEFMKHVGVLRLTVGDTVVLEQEKEEEKWAEKA